MNGRWTTRRRLFVAGGAAFWIVLLVLATVRASTRSGDSSPVGRAWKFARAERRTVGAEMPRGWLWPGDRVLRLDGKSFRACGEVVSIERPVGGASVTLALYPDAGLPDPLPPGTRLSLMDERGTLEWAFSRVFSPERQTELAAELRTMVSEREGWLRQAFGPVLEEFTRGVVADVTAELTTFVQTHEDELRGLGEDILERAKGRWEPILRDKLWPKILARLEPLGVTIGNELWAALPLADVVQAGAESVGGSLINWALPSDYELDEGEFDKWREGFLRDKAIPIITGHVPDALTAVEQSVTELLDDPAVQDAIRASFFDDALGNPKVIALVTEAFATAVLANQRLQDRLERLLDDPRVQRGLFDLAEQLEPRLMGMARSLLLDDEGRLHPELAMLARVRLIGSEGNWILLDLPVDVDARPSAAKQRLIILPYEGTRAEPWEAPQP
ncbi:MAG: hypothetical protein HY905_07905 [Deltaproteobacteria bacterium]|nr:hypothetical protein [Deltaproteobacteria bacterium]